MTPGALRYSRDGSRLAVVGAAAIKVHDADNLAGPLLAAFPGQAVDAAFSPVDNASLATLTPSGGDYFLSVVGVGNGVFLGPVTVHPANLTGAPAVSASRPRLSWSPDGRRVSVAFDTRTAGGIRALRVTEWEISGGAARIRAVAQPAVRLRGERRTARVRVSDDRRG